MTSGLLTNPITGAIFGPIENIRHGATSLNKYGTPNSSLGMVARNNQCHRCVINPTESQWFQKVWSPLAFATEKSSDKAFWLRLINWWRGASVSRSPVAHAK